MYQSETKFRPYFGDILLPILEMGKLRPVFVVFFHLSCCNLFVNANVSQ